MEVREWGRRRWGGGRRKCRRRWGVDVGGGEGRGVGRGGGGRVGVFGGRRKCRRKREAGLERGGAGGGGKDGEEVGVGVEGGGESGIVVSLSWTPQSDLKPTELRKVPRRI